MAPMQSRLRSNRGFSAIVTDRSTLHRFGHFTPRPPNGTQPKICHTCNSKSLLKKGVKHLGVHPSQMWGPNDRGSLCSGWVGFGPHVSRWLGWVQQKIDRRPSLHGTVWCSLPVAPLYKAVAEF